MSHWCSFQKRSMESHGINVVQRRKRLEAVESKLKRYRTMNLAEMNDIAGCRAIVQCTIGIKQLGRFLDICKSGWAGHELKDTDDYVQRPRSTGYRGVHLIYRYRSDNSSFDRRLIEVQFRS